MKPIRRNVWTTLLAFFFLVGVSAIPLAEAGVTGPGPTGPAGPSGPAPSGTGPVGVVAGVATAPSSCASNSLITWGTSGPACTHLSAGVVTTDASGVATAGIAPPAYGGTGQDFSASTGIPIATAGTFAIIGTTGTSSVVRKSAPALSGNVTIDNSAVGSTVGTIGAERTTSTAATAGNPQFSALNCDDANGWNSTAGASQQLQFCWDVEPAGTTAGVPTGNYKLYGRSNNGAWSTKLTVGSAFGDLTSAGTIKANGATIVAYEPGAGTSVPPGFIALNDTAAALGAQQNSADYHYVGRGYGTTAGTSQIVEARSWLLPVQGLTPTWTLTWDGQINAGGYSTAMTLTNAGVLLLPSSGGLASNGYVSAQAGVFGYRSGIHATSTTAVSASNTIAATLSNPSEYGGAIASIGSAWDTDDAVPRNVVFRCDTEPTSGTTVGGSYVCASSVDGAAYSPVYSVSTAGTLTTNGNLTVSSGRISRTNNAKGTADFKAIANVQTTSATRATADTIATANNTAYVYSAIVIGIDSAHSTRYGYDLKCTCVNNAGTLACDSTATASGGATMTNAPDCVVSGTNLIIEGGGIAATTIQQTFAATFLSVVP